MMKTEVQCTKIQSIEELEVEQLKLLDELYESGYMSKEEYDYNVYSITDYEQCMKDLRDEMTQKRIAILGPEK